MRKKRRGSSLVVVVIIFGMLIVFGTAMLSMTTGEYRLRTQESKRVENLYSSESGLDLAYNIIIKTFNAAVIYGDKKAEEFKVTQIAKIRKQNEDDKKANPKAIMKAEEVSYTDINNTFQDAFRAFINPIKPIDDKFTNRCQDELRRAIFNNQYIQSIQDDGAGSFKISDAAVTFSGDKPEMRIDLNDGIKYDLGKKQYSIKIQSSFTSKSTTGDNLRKIEANYDLTVPNYGDVSYEESNKVIGKYPALQKIINVDGNMSIDMLQNTLSNITTNIEGNIFVKGKGESTLVANNKYKGGIIINGANVNFNDDTDASNNDVATSNTFNIQNNAHVTLGGNLYAGNVYAGNAGDVSETTNTGEGDKSSLTIDKDMIVDNDLAIKANETQINMKNFYGINDIIDTTAPKARTSSSIIVNGGNKTSEIKVSDSAYIMGVAYIDAGIGYQTGESLAVKGNYLAYASHLDKFPNCQFEQYGPLQLVKGLNVSQMSEYFKEFSQQYSDKMNYVKIDLNKIMYSAGAIVYKNSKGEQEFKESKDSLDSLAQANLAIGKQKTDYALKVTDLSAYNALGQKIDSIPTPLKDILKAIPTSVYNLNDQKSDTVTEKAIFNGDDTKTIVIEGTSLPEEYKDDDRHIVLHGENLNAVIATAGKVIIDGKVNFRGNILAMGDLEIKGAQQKNITYDEDLSNRIQSANLALFKSVFGTPTETEGSVSDSGKNELVIRYDIKNYLKSKLWKIIE